MKKFILTFITFIILGATCVYAYQGVDVRVNGTVLQNTGIVKDNRTLVGVRGVFEHLGYKVEWDRDTSTATLTNDDYKVVLTNGKDDFTVNGKTIKCDVPQQIINSRFYLPLRAVGTATHSFTDWNSNTKTAIITNTNYIKDVDNLDIQEDSKVSVATPGVHTVKNLLLTGLQPVGSTMYVYGGGWNESDTGAGIEAVTIGLDPKWSEFANKQSQSYNYKNYDYTKNVDYIHYGLDCSGFVGWTLYNTINRVNNLDGLVDKSSKIANNLYKFGWGEYTYRGKFTDYKAGDILSSAEGFSGHVWICLGQCADGSVVLLHSSPRGVQISGTYTRAGNKNSDAVKLANQYMKKYYPQWTNKYADSSRDSSYLKNYNRFRWTIGKKLYDPEGITNMTAQQVLNELFN